MGRLLFEGEPRRSFVLPTRCLVGRGAASALRLEESDVSVEHASLRWCADHWELRDLGSKNGTFHDGGRVPSGISVRLSRGALLRFGGSSQWRLGDDGAPAILALEIDGLAAIEGRDYLVLPDDAHPEISVFRDRRGHVCAESASENRILKDGDLIVCQGRSFRIFLPEGPAGTAEAELASDAPELELFFGVSSDEEHATLRVRFGSREVDLGERTHHYVLLTLARLKDKEARDANLSPSSIGWIQVNELARLLGNDRAYVNLCVHRLRRQLADSGVPCVAELVERRATSGELRLGAARFHIDRR